jgi:flagellar protein FlaG
MNTDLSINASKSQNLPLQAAVVMESSPKVQSPDPKPVSASPDIVLNPPKAPKLQLDVKELEKNLKEAIQMLNEQMKSSGRNLNFSIDQEVNRTIITVKNSNTGELVRQIPDETVLRVAHSIEKVKGMLLDELA